MDFYAFLDDANIVTEVIAGVDRTELIDGLDAETWYGNFRNQSCKLTSVDGEVRKNYAGIGYTYDENLDAFIPPRPFESWTLNTDTCIWDAPTPRPMTGVHRWDEETQSWVEISTADE